MQAVLPMKSFSGPYTLNPFACILTLALAPSTLNQTGYLTSLFSRNRELLNPYKP